jgi:hypothetical protein
MRLQTNYSKEVQQVIAELASQGIIAGHTVITEAQRQVIQYKLLSLPFYFIDQVIEAMESYEINLSNKSVLKDCLNVTQTLNRR